MGEASSNWLSTPLIDENGLPVANDTASNSTSGTFWEEMEQELRSQPTGRAEPMAFEMAPSDGMSGGAQPMEMSKEEKCQRLKTIQEELLFTLASRFNGYANLEDIKRDFNVDSGLIPDLVAQQYGYQKFEDFFQSDLVKSVYKLVVYEGQPTYVPRDCSKFKHIRDEQMVSNDTIVRKEDEMEMEKLARALLPENTEQYINGKKIILKILHELGGETQQILWMRIQEKYKQETGKELAGDELRKMFQRDKALKILTKFFKNDVDVWDANAPGVFYLRLKKPYNEIMRDFDEIIRDQQEAIKKFRANKRQSHHNGGNHRAKLTMEEKFRPVNSLFAPTVDQSVFYEQSTSQNTAKPLPTNHANSSENPSNLPNDGVGRTPSPPQMPSDRNCFSSSKTKFELPNDVNESNSNWTKNISKTAANEHSQRTRVNWDGQSLAHYDGTGGGEGKEQTTNGSKNNGKTKENSSKKKYTSRNTGTYTDSEEEEADNEEEEDARSDVTLMDQKVRREGQNGTGQLQQKDANPRRRATFDDEPQEQSLNAEINRSNTAKPVGHQKAIQKFMRERMEQKGITAPTQRTNSSAVVEQNEPNAITGRNGKFDLSMMDNGSANTDKGNATPALTVQPNRLTHANDGQSNSQMDDRNATTYSTQSHNHPNLETHQMHANVLPAREPLHLGSVFSARPSVDSSRVFQLMEHVEELRNIANEKGFSHETRFDEGSFTFRRGDKLLIFTEFDEEKIRGSVHSGGRICNDRYFPKVDWDMFYSAILGLLSRNFEMPRSQPRKKSDPLPFPSVFSEERFSSADPKKLPWGCPPEIKGSGKNLIELEEPSDTDLREALKTTRDDSSVPPVVLRKQRDKTIAAWLMPNVPNSFLGRGPPFPSHKKTVDGRAFLCFFSKVYAFSNHYSANFRIAEDIFCCSEQYYMWRKSKYFGFDRTADEIMENGEAKVIKHLGHADSLRNKRRMGMEPNSREFDHDEWREAKEEIMLTALRAKFTQNPELGRMLVGTEDALLVEASPTDKYWGIGCAMDSEEIAKPTQWQGLNRMGNLLETLRQEIRWGGQKLDEPKRKKNGVLAMRTNKYSF
ncbi:hypothetical protein niasHS_010898 [Heterodera schachtii]|uniref:NADAR domain-containing protein n=1 Tax=Heterodera schachtii TaxID=97005 RepID=A0ABD2J014_HETSC